MNRTNSQRLFEEAKRVLPGGVDSPVRAFRAVGGAPLFIARGKGDTIEDADGNRYIDYVMSWGPLILGHARSEVVAAVQSAAADGLSFGAPTGRETRLAEAICAASGAEMARLVNSGTEACMSAIRLARGYTGRDKIIKFEGCYHGHSDGLLVKAGSGCLTGAMPDSAGVPASYARETLVADYNDPASAEALFNSNRGEVACVIVEPVAANMGVVPPAPGFLQALRRLCDANGALLIFDEVITGFRVSFGGAAALYGVRPDLFAFGKIVGGGMPLAAYAGKREIMQCVAPSGKVYQAGTLSGNPAATAAGLKTLEILEKYKDEIYPSLEEKGAELESAYREAGVPVNRVGSLLSPFFAKEAPASYADVKKCDLAAFAEYFAAMQERGIYVAPSQFEAMFLSAAHTEEHIGKTRSAIAFACGQALKGNG